MIKVAAGIIESENRILIARRKEGKHLAGLWEFPGGKIEIGETPESCLKRELYEELGVDVMVGRFFMENICKYDEKTVQLKSYKCKIVSGDIALKDHDKMEWVAISNISNFKFAPADIPFVTALVNEDKFNRTAYSIKSFLSEEVSIWGERLKEHIIACMGEKANYSQKKAWFDSHQILKTQLIKISNKAQDAKIIFEYELPRERGRRPDVLILSGNNLLVIEFKGYSTENLAQIDQVKHYARDLKNYHEKSHNLNIVPFLVLTATKETNKVIDSVNIISGDILGQTLAGYVSEGFTNMTEWYYSEYAPLPNLIQSAQLIFKENRFPQIKKANSAGIPQALKELSYIVSKAEQNNSHHLVLISGVPGAGKTLVGIQFVFESHKKDIKQKAVLLSGNGPLVNVLQSSLDNKNFVQAVHGFLKEYAHSTQLPSENVLIYDEAQRAWDSEKVAQSKRVGSNSEPTDLISIGNKKAHCVIIGLIGEGQEIHLGEESGLRLWSDALTNSSKSWNIHCPTKFIPYFENNSVEENDVFNLTTSLRTHQTISLQNWVGYLLENNLEALQRSTSQLSEEDYPIYITRNLTFAKNYLRQKYVGEEAKTYGIIASSKSRILPKYNVYNDFNSTKAFTPAQYYVDKNNPAYCKNLNTVVTEFACQGLELDMPIVAWDIDFVYNGKWIDTFPNKKAKASLKLRKNSYRVLLTRGRDGMIIFVPDDVKLNTTFEFLVNNGCKILE
ncbi:DNA/RNA helicase domain-containing protein [Cellulophaga baltica]|uniref:DNA/RNA helicase domain-containing protein n=1 Tax=Cellulophaga baltica TaxID=76594 RepID=UPI00041A4561|nr:DNA/RNA helicase domain-containing protein [Cellulophaga baltica]